MNNKKQHQEKPFLIKDRYEKLDHLGEGTYGVVFKAFDHQNQKFVAIKKIKLDNDEDEGIPATSLREMSVLKKLDHPNIVKLIEVILIKEQTAVYLVFEYYEQDLRAYIRTFRKQEGHTVMELGYYQEMFKQILSAVDYCHANGIQHRDLKPHNILVDKEGNIKIADFGLARAFNFPMKRMTREIVTLWYRSPELLLGSYDYDLGVDMWSIGCILSEFCTWRPIFSGDSQIDQIFKIFQYGGTPTNENWEGVEDLPEYSKLFPKFKKQDIFNQEVFLQSIGKQGAHLLESMLQLDPSKRINCQEALQHPFFKNNDYQNLNLNQQESQQQQLHEFPFLQKNNILNKNQNHIDQFQQQQFQLFQQQQQQQLQMQSNSIDNIN